jgi:hypothetical protein
MGVAPECHTTGLAAMREIWCKIRCRATISFKSEIVKIIE